MTMEKGSLAAWSKKHLEDELKQPAGFQFAARAAFSEKILAVLCGRIMADEGEILKVAVSQTVRHMGIGRLLLNYGLDYCRQQGVKRCYLELRASNSTARELYEKCGFSVVGTRKGYYVSPREDAVLMQREV
jgi:ribosomal-protein-alanine N-acetyltransferase